MLNSYIPENKRNIKLIKIVLLNCKEVSNVQVNIS